MRLASIRTQVLISYCSPFQGRMEGASTSVYEFENMIRGQHVYKSVWISLTDWCSKTRKWMPVREDDEHDKNAINDQL